MKRSVTDLVRGMRDMPISVVPVILTAILACGLYVFFRIADGLDGTGEDGFDRALLLFFRDPADAARPIGPAWLTQTLTEITALGGYPVLVLLVSAVAGFLLISRKYGPALFVFLSVGTGTLAGHLLKLAYDRPRPDLVDHLVDIHTPSFPSGHATMSAVVYLTLASLIVRLVDRAAVRAYVLAVAIALTVAIGFSRVYLGVHWPSDVAAGWAIGTAWACLSWLVVAALKAWRARRRR